ncbi:hypothetical protein Rhopal_006833-T1 [Rhodotorula paludigena]|uniref:Uncharacterized protein n=1 Tax=Rhodotorula paludigena TaxID=86838 RepID=A0AAV5GV26_9BASI|nr:hypothetical protein Rhopal_006833-T1 [Rhodotorula paludigena]
MRPSSLRLATRPIPLASVPAHALRLPPPPVPSAPRPSKDPRSPTVDRLLKSFARPAPAHDARGLGARALPPNLRINEWVPPRKEYQGVKASHRDLLRRLRREA